MAGKREKFSGQIIQPEDMANEPTAKPDTRIKVPLMSFVKFETFMLGALKAAKAAGVKTVKGHVDGWK